MTPDIPAPGPANDGPIAEPFTAAMAQGRRADSARRRQRVLTALTEATNAGDPISVSAIARRAGVDRSFLYRHPDLLERSNTSTPWKPPHQTLRAPDQASPGPRCRPTCSTPSNAAPG